MENMYNSANRGFDNLFKSVLTEDIDSKKTTKRKSLSESVKKNDKKASNRVSEKLSLIRKKRISEAMRRVRRPIAEARVSSEGERDNVLIRSAVDKRSARPNAKLTPSERLLKRDKNESVSPRRRKHISESATRKISHRVIKRR